MRQPTRSLLAWSLLALLAALPTVAATPRTKAGSITFWDGRDVDAHSRYRVFRNGREQPLKMGMPLYGGDRVSALVEGYCIHLEVWSRAPRPTLGPIDVCRATGEWPVPEVPDEDSSWIRALSIVTDGLKPDRGREEGRPGSRRRDPTALMPIVVTGGDGLQASMDRPVVVWRGGQPPFSLAFRSGKTSIEGIPWNGDSRTRAGRPAKPLSPGSWTVEVTDARGLTGAGAVAIRPGAQTARADHGVGVAAVEALCLRFGPNGQVIEATGNLIAFEALPEARSALEVLAEAAPTAPLDAWACATILKR